MGFFDWFSDSTLSELVSSISSLLEARTSLFKKCITCEKLFMRLKSYSTFLWHFSLLYAFAKKGGSWFFFLFVHLITMHFERRGVLSRRSQVFVLKEASKGPLTPFSSSPISPPCPCLPSLFEDRFESNLLSTTFRVLLFSFDWVRSSPKRDLMLWKVTLKRHK